MMPPCDRCAGDAFLIEAGFTLTAWDGGRYAVRGDLRYEIPPACREHATPDRKAA